MDELNKYKKGNPFKAPEGYFENFEEKLNDKIKETKSPKSDWKIPNIKPYLAIAAAFLLIFSLWQVLLLQFGDDDALAKDGQQTEEAVLLSYLQAVDTDELIQILANEEILYQDITLNSESDIEIIIDDLDETVISNEIEDMMIDDELFLQGGI